MVGFVKTTVGLGRTVGTGGEVGTMEGAVGVLVGTGGVLLGVIDAEGVESPNTCSPLFNTTKLRFKVKIPPFSS